MYCTNCGQEIPDKSKFCPKCGNPTMVAPSQTPPAAAPSPAPDGAAQAAADPHMATQAATEPGKNDNARQNSKKGGAGRIILPILIVAVIGLIAFVAFRMMGASKETINLSEYVVISYEGYDTFGTASYELDTVRFDEDYNDRLKVTAASLEKSVKNSKAASKELEALIEYSGGYEAYAELIESEDVSTWMLSSYGGELSTTEDLSNGDTVTYSWDIPEDSIAELEAVFGCNITAEDITVTVSGLAEIETFDPFDGVDLQFTGIAPDGEAVLESIGQDDLCGELSYTVEPQNGLSNGDTVTVTVSRSYEDWETDMARNYGKQPSQTTKEYTVSGLCYYATSLSELSDEFLATLQEQADAIRQSEIDESAASDAEYIKTETQKGYSFTASHETLQREYLGCYFLAAKDGTDTRLQNRIYLVYKVKSHSHAAQDDTTFNNTQVHYMYYGFNNILITEDGDYQVDYTDYCTAKTDGYSTGKVDTGLRAHGFLSFGNYTESYDGFDDLNLMYNQLVTIQIDKYSCESTVEDVDLDESAAGETADEAATEAVTEDSADEASTEAAE